MAQENKMANEPFRPRRINEGDLDQSGPPQSMDMNKLAAMQRAAGSEVASIQEEEATLSPDAAQQVKMQGNVPPEAWALMQQAVAGGSNKGPKSRPTAASAGPSSPADVIRNFLDLIDPVTSHYEQIELPSKGKFYDGSNGPVNGILHVRPMTGVEEKILATPRFVKKGTAVNMIFKNCLMEKFDPDTLLSIDRTYLLIYLRGISYSPEYEVQIKCPECSSNFSTTVDLDSLYVDTCPDDFGTNTLHGELPATKIKFTYRLSTGQDETQIAEHRERRVKMWGDNSHDDTLLFRAALLVEQLETPGGQTLSGQANIQSIIERLPIKDVAHLRNLLSEPPFGVDTKINLVCPSCTAEFNTDLPLESNFFFPRTPRAPANPA